MIADMAPDVAMALSVPWPRPALRSLEHVVIRTRGITRGIYDVELRRLLRTAATREDTLLTVYGALLVDAERLLNELR